MTTPPLAMPANYFRDDERERCADCHVLLDGLRVLITPKGEPYWSLTLCLICAVVAMECDDVSVLGLGRRARPPDPPPVATWWA